MECAPCHITATAIDIDVTDDCNLRCVYCFKGPKSPRYIDNKTARRAVDWIIHASRDYPDISVNFMGGEPLLAWNLIKELVLWGRNRAKSYGKNIRFSMTTNLTLMNDEIRAFVDQYGFGVLMSIDGCPELHDKQRIAQHPDHRYKTVEYWARSLLRTRPRSDARMTLIPRNVSLLAKSFQYLTEEIGFQSVVLSAADYPDWTDELLQEYKEQMELIASMLEQGYKNGKILSLKLLTWMIKMIIHPRRQGKNITERVSPCGAGYNYQMIDFNGNIWPCHRFDFAIQIHNFDNELKMGNIFENYYNDKLANVFLNFNFKEHQKEECKSCPIFVQCAGGCPACNLYYMRNIYLPHENYCRLRQIEYKVAEKLYNKLIDDKNETFIKDLEKPFN